MYGELPKVVGFTLDDSLSRGEYLYYQYMPIKLAWPKYLTLSEILDFSLEQRIRPFFGIFDMISKDFIDTFDLDRYKRSYVYLTLKRQYQKPNCGFNRPGWHSDSFMSDDINYLWSSSQPTIFNSSSFNLSQDDKLSLKEMEEQALPENNLSYDSGYILRLNQFCIHKVGEIQEGVRTFLKVTFSDKQFNLEGNSHNYLLNYNWDMRPRKKERNIPHES